MNIKLPEEITSKALFSHIMEFLLIQILLIFNWQKNKPWEIRYQESFEKMTDMIEHCRLGENRVG